jgi:hypothetical protein
MHALAQDGLGLAPLGRIADEVGELGLHRRLYFLREDLRLADRGCGDRAHRAGEPALAIQLYARLIARFPESAFIEQARGAVQAQKERLAKP